MIEFDEIHEEAEVRLKSAREYAREASDFARRIAKWYSWGHAALRDTQDAYHRVSRLGSALALATPKLKQKDYQYIDWVEVYAKDARDNLKAVYESVRRT